MSPSQQKTTKQELRLHFNTLICLKMYSSISQHFERIYFNIDRRHKGENKIKKSQKAERS